MLEDGYSNKDVAKKFNITPEYVTAIKIGKYHTNITKNYKFQKRDIKFRNEEIIHKICKMLEDGYRNIDIIETYKVPPTIVSSIRCGTRYKSISKYYKIPKHIVKRRIDDGMVNEICRFLKEGKTMRHIAETLNTS